MHILIIGAAGMVGRKFTERLVRDGGLGGRTIAKATLHDVIEPTGSRRRALRGDDGRLRLRRAGRSRASSSPAGPISSSISPPSSPARPRPTSTRATASTSTARGCLFEAIRADRRRLQAAGRLHLVHRGVRRAVPRSDRRRVLHHAADLLRHAEGDRRTAARRLFPQGLLRRGRHPPADDLRAPGQRRTRRPPASSPTSSASRWPATRRCCRSPRTCATGMPRRARRSASSSMPRPSTPRPSGRAAR